MAAAAEGAQEVVVDEAGAAAQEYVLGEDESPGELEERED